MPEASSFEILTDGMMGYIVSKQRVQVANLNPQGELAGSWLKWLAPCGCTVSDIVVNSSLKVSPEFLHCRPLKSDTVFNSQDFSGENSVSRVKFDTGYIPLICHYVLHGITSKYLNHSRSSPT